MDSSKKKITDYVNQQSSLDLLKFITCGSVDDGKSTLIGRLLYEAQLIFEDQIAALKNDSKRYGTQVGEIDFADHQRLRSANSNSPTVLYPHPRSG